MDAEAPSAGLQMKVELIDPFEMERHRQLAELYEARGEWLYATRSRTAVLDLDPVDRAGAHYELARTLVALGDLEAARQQVLRSLEIAPMYGDGLELLLTIVEQRGQ